MPVQKHLHLKVVIWCCTYPRRYTGRSPKCRFHVGPYKITAALNDVNFALKLSPRSKPIVAHIDKLRPFYGSKLQYWQAAKKSNHRSYGEDIQESLSADVVSSKQQPVHQAMKVLSLLTKLKQMKFLSRGLIRKLIRVDVGIKTVDLHKDTSGNLISILS
jgi:hypothetical protein